MYAGLQSGNLQHGFFFLPHSPFFFFFNRFFPLNDHLPCLSAELHGKMLPSSGILSASGTGSCGGPESGAFICPEQRGAAKGIQQLEFKDRVWQWKAGCQQVFPNQGYGESKHPAKHADYSLAESSLITGKQTLSLTHLKTPDFFP